MKYWSEFESKYGFNDGDSIPPDAEARRDVYLKVVNALAKKHGSSMRYCAYNRSGFHNCYLLLPKEVNITDEEVQSGTYIGPKNLDSAMIDAIQEACEYDLDDLIFTKVEIDEEGLDSLLEAIENEEDEEDDDW